MRSPNVVCPRSERSPRADARHRADTDPLSRGKPYMLQQYSRSTKEGSNTGSSNAVGPCAQPPPRTRVPLTLPSMCRSRAGHIWMNRRGDRPGTRTFLWRNPRRSFLPRSGSAADRTSFSGQVVERADFGVTRDHNTSATQTAAGRMRHPVSPGDASSRTGTGSPRRRAIQPRRWACASRAAPDRRPGPAAAHPRA